MDNELYHHGILGQKWGIRRYQNKDGTLTAAGKKKYNRETDELKTKEREYSNLSTENKSKGKAITERILNNVVVPAAEEIGKQLVKSILTKELNKRIKDDSLKIYTNNNKKK